MFKTTTLAAVTLWAAVMAFPAGAGALYNCKDKNGGDVYQQIPCDPKDTSKGVMPGYDAGPGPSAFQEAGEPITLNFRSVPLSTVFKLLGEVAGIPIVLDPALDHETSIRAINIPWNRVMAKIVNKEGLRVERRDGMLYVYK